MGIDLEELIERYFPIEENEGESKVLDLSEAIRRYVQPGMTIFTGWDANAAICETIRQFWGRDPKFTVAGTITSDHVLGLIHGNQVRKLITTNCGHQFPTPSPARVVQRAFREKTLEIEQWSLYTLQQRFMAAALDLGFVTTKCILGTSLEEENSDSFKAVDDPFGSGQRLGLLKALSPDMTFLHAWAADRYGNTITSVINQDSLWGAKAAKQLIVTVEHIVPTDVIRQHSPLVKIPGYKVTAVCHVPFGAHPQGMTNHALPAFEPYGQDYDFMAEHTEACRNRDTLDAWMKEWVLGCPDHNAYLRKLGTQRLLELKGKGSADSWRFELQSSFDPTSLNAAPTAREAMLAAATRKIVQRVLEGRFKVVLAGAGLSTLPAWKSFYDLKRHNYHVDMLIGGGVFGYAPRPGDTYLAKIANIPSCKILTDICESYGVIVGGQGARCLSILGGGQVDRYGNINSGKISEDTFLTGPGGSNDNSSGAAETLIVIPQSPTRYVDQLPHISCTGDRAQTLISTMGIYEKRGSEEFVLTQYFPNSKSRDERIREIKENCGWELKVAPDVEEAALPTQEELTVLRLFDPKGFFTRD